MPRSPLMTRCAVCPRAGPALDDAAIREARSSRQRAISLERFQSSTRSSVDTPFDSLSVTPGLLWLATSRAAN